MERMKDPIKLAENRGDKRERHGKIPFNLSDAPNVNVPVSLLEENKVVAGTLTNPVSEYYRMLRTKLLRIMAQNNWQLLGVTGPTPSSGKTVTSTNLAVAIAMEPNHSALLVDADLRKNSLSDIFGVTPRKGICEFVSGKAEFDEILFRPGIDNLGVVMNNRPRYGSSDLLMRKPLLQMMNTIKSDHPDMVAIFDLPPVFVGDDAIAMSAHLDAVLLIVDSGNTTKQQLANCIGQLEDVNIIGCVLNNASEEDCAAKLDVNYYRSMYTDD